jgi:hypothetical protein
VVAVRVSIRMKAKISPKLIADLRLKGLSNSTAAPLALPLRALR